MRRDRRQKPLRVGAGRQRRFPEPRGAALGRASGCMGDGVGWGEEWCPRRVRKAGRPAVAVWEVL